MTHKEFGERLKKFKRKHQLIKHNPIRPLKYPEFVVMRLNMMMSIIYNHNTIIKII
ncbi:MAG: hypothetical protein IJK18_03440 [Clostridia bacterium]|nr:hypothetical protein [Clostridia bacterium]